MALLQEGLRSNPDDPQALFLMGRAYEDGWGGLRPDHVKALELLSKAADGGNHYAGWKAGMLLIQGEGVSHDPRRAYRLIRRAAEGGDPRAQTSTAVMLATAEGVEQDDVQARAWYRRAAEQGVANALKGLGSMLVRGEGGEREPVRGFAYLELAREAGNAEAEELLTIAAPEPTAAQRAEMDRIKADWLARYGSPE